MIQKALLSFFVLFYVSYSFANMVKLEWRHYTSSPSIKEQLSDYVFFKWDNKVDFTKGPFHFDSQFQFEYSLDRSQFVYFNIPELYLLYEYELEAPLYSLRSIEINIGRKVKQWSLGDEYWDLGLWNPLTRWNPLHPSTNGLVGSFFTVKADQWESDFFVGALYVPDQEVSVVEENGRIYSRSRWFPMLPSQVNSLNIDIHYSSGNPFIFDILFQQSFLFNFKTWSKTPEVFYWMKWSFADKPVNHLFFILNQNNRIQVEEEEGEVFVNQKITVLPVRQRILSTEWGLDYRDISIAFSLENTKMKEASIPPKYWSFVKERDNFTYFSALLKYDYLDNSFFRLAFIQSWFRRVDLSQGDPSLLVRSKILEGAGFDWQTKLFSYKEQPVFFALKYQYSFLDQGAWLFAKALFYVTSRAYTEVTIDILGAVDLLKNKTSKNRSLLNTFKHNDYFTWSVAYDF